MATITVDLGQGDLVASKGEDIVLPYSIEPPIAGEEDVKDYTQIIEITNNPNVPTEGKFPHLKKEWIEVQKVSIDHELNLVTTGIKVPSFKYKIEFTTIEGKVLQEIESFQDEYITLEEKLESEMTIPITLITSAIQTYQIKLTVKFETGQIVEKKRNVILYNDNPAVIITVKKNVAYISISDDSTDLIRYNIKLNGKHIFPEDGEYTAWQEPTTTTIALDRKNIKINEANTITVNVQDEWGGQNTTDYLFIGRYYGVMFSDSKGEYYSDDLGQVLKTLNFGTLTAGKTSNIERVRIYNRTEEIITKLVLKSDEKEKPNKLIIFFGWDINEMQTDEEVLEYNKNIEDDAFINLYIQVKPDLEYEERKSTFDLILEAETINKEE